MRAELPVKLTKVPRPDIGYLNIYLSVAIHLCYNLTSLHYGYVKRNIYNADQLLFSYKFTFFSLNDFLTC